MLVADRAARSQAGMDALVELAELLQASVISTQPDTMPPLGAGRMNFPSRHPLNHTLRTAAAIAEGDLDRRPRDRQFLRRDQRLSRPDPAQLPSGHQGGREAGDDQRRRAQTKANYQDFQRYSEVDLGAGRRCRGDVTVANRGSESPVDRRSASGSSRSAG